MNGVPGTCVQRNEGKNRTRFRSFVPLNARYRNAIHGTGRVERIERNSARSMRSMRSFQNFSLARSARSQERKERNSLRSFLENGTERKERNGTQAFIFGGTSERNGNMALWVLRNCNECVRSVSKRTRPTLVGTQETSRN